MSACRTIAGLPIVHDMNDSACDHMEVVGQRLCAFDYALMLFAYPGKTSCSHVDGAVRYA
jgi:hypothetical protein